MAKSSKIKVLLISVLAVLLCGLTVFAFNTQSAMADTSFGTLTMDTGAYLKASGDGGLRLRAVFDEDVKDALEDDGTNLFFKVMTKDTFDGANGDFSGVDTKVQVDKSLIYTDGTNYFANCLLNFDVPVYGDTFCAVAYITDGTNTQYATFEDASQVSKNLYEVVNSAVLDDNNDDRIGELTSIYTFIGSSDFPYVASTTEAYNKLVDRINAGEIANVNLKVEPSVDTTQKEIEAEKQQGITVEKYFTVVFKNYDGTVLDTQVLKEGATPEYKGETPTKPATAQYTYTFDRFDVLEVTADAEYTAKFTETVNKYTISIEKDGSSVLEDAEEVSSFTKEYNTELSFLNNIVVSKSGCEFVKWQMKDGESYVNFSLTTKLTKDITIKPVLLQIIELSTTAELYALRNGGINRTAYYKLTNDIDMTGYDWYDLALVPNFSWNWATADIVMSKNAPDAFNGVFDGQGHTVSNIRTSGKGIFGAVGPEGIIKNVGFYDVDVAGTEANLDFGLAVLFDGKLENVSFVMKSGSDEHATISKVLPNASFKNVVIYANANSSSDASGFYLTKNNSWGGNFVNVYVVSNKIYNAGVSCSYFDIANYTENTDFTQIDFTTIFDCSNTGIWKMDDTLKLPLIKKA